MARTKKASYNQQNRKAVQQRQSANKEAVGTTPMRSLTTPRESLHRSLRCKDENAGSISTGSFMNEEANVTNNSAITEDNDISGVSVLITDDSEASSIIDLTNSIIQTEENSEFANVDDQQHGSATARRKSIRKSVKRLVCTTTPRYVIANGRTSKGTPYIRKVSSTNHHNYLANETKFSKKKGIAEEIKKSVNVNVKRVTFNNTPSMKASSTATKSNQSKPLPESMQKKQSTVKMPNFSDIHKKMFEKMESIDVTVRKREERKKAASMQKESKGSSQGTSTKSKKVVRKLDNSQTGLSNIPQAGDTNTVVSDSPKSLRSKSLRTAPMVGVLLERSPNCDTIFNFTGSVDSKIPSQPLSVRKNGNSIFKFTAKSDSMKVSQPVSDKKTVENRSARHQQAFKAGPVPKSHPQSLNRLKGVRLNRRFELQMKYRENQNELQSSCD